MTMGHVWILVSQMKRKQGNKEKDTTCIPKACVLNVCHRKKKRHLIPLVHSSCASAPRKRQQRGRKDLTLQGAQEGRFSKEPGGRSFLVS